jgi:hypothetical protein
MNTVRFENQGPRTNEFCAWYGMYGTYLLKTEANSLHKVSYSVELICIELCTHKPTS